MDCQKHCKDKGKGTYIEVYVYVIRDPNSVENSKAILAKVKEHYKDADFLNDRYSNFPLRNGIDFHGVRGLPDGTYDYQPCLAPKPEETIGTFTPTPENPEYPFAAPTGRILDKMCCCK